MGAISPFQVEEDLVCRPSREVLLNTRPNCLPKSASLSPKTDWTVARTTVLLSPGVGETTNRGKPKLFSV